MVWLWIEVKITAVKNDRNKHCGRPSYTGGQLTENTWNYENWYVRHQTCRRTVQGAETGGSVGKQVLYLTLWVNRALGQLSLELSKLVEKGRSSTGQQAVLLMNENFSPWTVRNKNRVIHQIGQHREVGLNTESVARNMKLCPRFAI
jgi:hypothetical protein